MNPKTGTKSNPTMVRAFMHAGADEPDEPDDDRLYLQIEFMNDHALTLSWPLGPDGAPPAVIVWRTRSKNTFGTQGLDRWREWLEGALVHNPSPVEDRDF